MDPTTKRAPGLNDSTDHAVIRSATGSATDDYLQTLPTAVPSGMVLVHNHVPPSPRFGSRGGRILTSRFRAWFSSPNSEALERCDCGWAPALKEHFRVRGESIVQTTRLRAAHELDVLQHTVFCVRTKREAIRAAVKIVYDKVLAERLANTSRTTSEAA